MPEDVWGVEFRDEATGSLYPFGDAATLVSADGAVALDRDLFVDATVYPVGGGAGLYLAAVEVAAGAVTFHVGIPAAKRLCSGSFDPLVTPAAIPLTDAYGRAAGLLVADPARLAAARAWPGGVHEFAPAATPFVAGCTIALPEAALRGLLLEDGTFLADAVWILGQDGVVVRLDEGGTQYGPGTAVVRIDVVGDPLAARRQCGPAGLFRTPRFLRTINGIGPDSGGNFHLEVDDRGAADTILRITPALNSLRLEAAGGTLRLLH